MAEVSDLISFAHFGGGHWWVTLLYLMPVTIVIGAIAWQARTARREERRARAGEPGRDSGTRKGLPR